MNRILAMVFKGIATAFFLIFLGGVIFSVTHANSKATEPSSIVNSKDENGEVVYNSEFAKYIIREISSINNVKAVAFFEIEDSILIGIETERNADAEYLNELKSFVRKTITEHSEIRSEKILIEINNENSNDISELAYYAGQGMAVNILTSRFEDIYGDLLDD